jgi:hypothetical protein
VQSGGKVLVFKSIQIPFYLRDTYDKSDCCIPKIKSAFTLKDFYVSIISHGVASRKTADRILISATNIPVIESTSIYLGGRKLYSEGCTICPLHQILFLLRALQPIMIVFSQPGSGL